MSEKYTRVVLEGAWWMPLISEDKRDAQRLPESYACEDCGAIVWNRSLHNARCPRD